MRRAVILVLAGLAATAPAVAAEPRISLQDSFRLGSGGSAICSAESASRDPALKVHLYGKAVRPGRKIGHVTALGDDLADVQRRAREGAHYLRSGEWLS